MKRLSLLAAAALLATAAHAQTPPPSDLPPSVGTNPSMPAEVTPGSAAERPPATLPPQAQPADVPAATSGTGSAAQEVANERRAAATEMQRLSREGARAQREAMALRGGGELSTPQQDRGGYSGLGDESPLPLR